MTAYWGHIAAEQPGADAIVQNVAGDELLRRHVDQVQDFSRAVARWQLLAELAIVVAGFLIVCLPAIVAALTRIPG